jgi:hypothetical protein
MEAMLSQVLKIGSKVRIKNSGIYNNRVGRIVLIMPSPNHSRIYHVALSKPKIVLRFYNEDLEETN